MPINRLKISHFRNITSAELLLSPGINGFYGQNGSGKTSLVEAIYYLSRNRSFRSHLNKRIIQEGFEAFQLYAALDFADIGIQKHLDRSASLKINGTEAATMAEITQKLPLLLLDTQIYELLDGPSEERRHFIDWGVFYVEHTFLRLWKRAQAILKQRNKALKDRLSRQEVSAWDPELVSLTEMITEMRRKYLEDFQKVLAKEVEEVDALKDIQWDFMSGWERSMAFADALEESFERDYQLGYTSIGINRADFKMILRGTPVKDYLSRGQKKMLIGLLLIAQGKFLKSATGMKPLYLVDDLPSELDETHQKILIEGLKSLESQIVVTGIESKDILKMLGKADALFHVEQGKIFLKKSEL